MPCRSGRQPRYDLCGCLTRHAAERSRLGGRHERLAACRARATDPGARPRDLRARIPGLSLRCWDLVARLSGILQTHRRGRDVRDSPQHHRRARTGYAERPPPMIDLLPSAGDEAIIDSVRAYVTAELPVSRFREGARTRGDFDHWNRFAELGWLSGADPAAGVDVVAEMLIFRELGVGLVSPALLATVLAAHLATADGQRRLTAELTQGHRHVALAYHVATANRPNYLYIIDGQADSLFLTGTEGGLALWDAVAAQNRVELHPFDATTSLTGAIVAPGAKPIAAIPSPTLLQRARVLTAAMATGSEETTQKLAVDYAKIRHAFGRPIGSI